MTLLRTGITTGTCATAAAYAAAVVLQRDSAPENVSVQLPNGQLLIVPVLYARQNAAGSEASVRKDAGDDPDVTDGVDVVVRLSWSKGTESRFIAGEGVGTITKPGLQIAPGQAAINPVPQAMILAAIHEVTDHPVDIEVSIPGGEDIALQTFNPRLGIAGGLSILGTTGIVRPYCKRAIRDSIRAALDVAIACGIHSPILVPGNIGFSAVSRRFRPADQQVIEVGNDWGFALEEVARHEFSALMLAGHPGKLAKMIQGDWDTHSSRSQSAVRLITSVGVEYLSLEMQPSETVEGLFAALLPPLNERLGNEISRQILDAVEKRIDLAFLLAVQLFDMVGNDIGANGDFTPWQ